jgi:hypothetical protein
MRELAEVHFPKVERIRVVLANVKLLGKRGNSSVTLDGCKRDLR